MSCCVVACREVRCCAVKCRAVSCRAVPCCAVVATQCISRFAPTSSAIACSVTASAMLVRIAKRFDPILVIGYEDQAGHRAAAMGAGRVRFTAILPVTSKMETLAFDPICVSDTQTDVTQCQLVARVCINASAIASSR